MIKKIALLLLFASIIGCNKDLKHLNKKQIENTKYEIVNKSLPRHLTKIIDQLKKNENYPFDFEKQIFELPAPLEFIKIEPYKNLIPQYYDLNQDKLYPLIKWDSDKLDGYRIIDTITYNRFKSLNNDRDIELFLSKWEDEIGYMYLNVANPIFNSDFSKCLLYFYYTDFNWMCGTGKDRLYEFTKIKNEWIFSKDLLEIKK